MMLIHQLIVNQHLVILKEQEIKYKYKNLNNHKKGIILKNNSQIINLIKNNINNNDYLMIKGSNSTGLHTLTKALKGGKINAL